MTYSCRQRTDGFLRSDLVFHGDEVARCEDYVGRFVGDASATSIRQLGWLRGTVVECWSLTSKLSMSCALLPVDGSPFMWVDRLL